MDINQALDTQRQEFHVKMERMRLWKQNFTKRCDQMKEQILKFDNFIQFRELSEVPVRYRALVSTHEALLRLVQEGHEERERRKARLGRYLEETSDERLQLSNRLADLQAQLEAARSRSLRWDAVWTHIQNTAARQTLVLGTVKMATLNLYQLVAGSLEEAPSLTSIDTLWQLQKIEEFIHHLKSVWEELMSDPHRAQNRLMK